MENNIENLKKYIEQCGDRGVQPYYAAFCYSVGLTLPEVLRNDINNRHFSNWIRGKHDRFRKEILKHCFAYTENERTMFLEWLKRNEVRVK